MKPLKPLDAAWLYADSRDTPMHVAGLQIFSLPKNAKASFVADLVAKLKEQRRLAPPWNLRLQGSALRLVLPAWEIDRRVDLDYHVRHSALPQPGGERELGVLVSRLHSQPLDPHRPLWECHLIEGLENGRIALYTKMHHSLLDGVGSMRVLQRAMSENPRQKHFDAPWVSGALDTRIPREDRPDDEVATPLTDAIELVKQQFTLLPDVGRALRQVWSGKGAEGGALAPPFSAPRCILNERIDAQRRFATQAYPLERLQGLAAKAGVSLNDVVLALCAAALRRFLRELGQLPLESLTAGLPVSLRPKGDASLGTAISFIIAKLGTDIADPRKRLQLIHESTTAAKVHLNGLPKPALDTYTSVFMAPYILGLLSGWAGHGRPMFSLAISNVPGPAKPLYFAGAKLEAMYPVSVLAHGQALNITCVSYAGSLNFGFTGCRDTVPHMQRLAVYTGEALDELEQALS